MIEKTEKEILKEIESGKYRNCYLIYNRKSTDEPNNQKNSIKFQKTENIKFAFNKKIPIAQIILIGFCTDGIISEKHSGSKEDETITFTKDGLVQYRVDRPKFLKLVEFLSRRLFKGVICLCWDRISRNKGDDTIVRKLMKSGVDIHFVYATYDKTSSGELHLDVDGMFAAHHSRVTSEKVKIATWMLRNKGVCTHKAPVGYLNEGTMEHKPFDPVRGLVVKQMFEKYVTGGWSLVDIACWANNQGFTTAPMRPRRTHEEILADEDDEDEKKEIEKISKPINANSIHRILINRFYTGRVLNSDGEWIASVSHKELVSDPIFAKVQLMLKKKNISRFYADKIDYPYRGIIRCGKCDRVYTPYKKKGIQYYETRCVNGCDNPTKNFNIAFLENKIGETILNLAFVDGEVEKFNATTQTDVAVFEQKRLEKIEQNERRKRKIREDLTYLRTNKLILLKSGVYSPEEFLGEENKLNSELTILQDAEQVSDATMHEVIKDITTLSELVKNGYEHYKNANSTEKEAIIRVIFSELSLSGNTLKYKCKNGFEALQSRFDAICGQGGS
ncbi:MAG: recombinase family protein [Candidatus Paceibacterota bacterium]